MYSDQEKTEITDRILLPPNIEHQPQKPSLEIYNVILGSIEHFCAGFSGLISWENSNHETNMFATKWGCWRCTHYYL